MTQVDDHARIQIREIAGYIQFYVDHHQLLAIIMIILSINMEGGDLSSIEQELVLGVLDSLLQATHADATKLDPHFAVFTCDALDCSVMATGTVQVEFTEWDVRFLGGLLDLGTADIILHMVDNLESCFAEAANDKGPPPEVIFEVTARMLYTFCWYLRGNDALQHRNLLPHLYAAFDTITQEMTGEDTDILEVDVGSSEEEEAGSSEEEVESDSLDEE